MQTDSTYHNSNTMLMSSMLVNSIACMLVSVIMLHCLSGLCYFSKQATTIGNNDIQ